jgi:hypothetical protein
MRVISAAFAALLLLFGQEAKGDEVADFVGSTASGLPGLGRVGVAAPRQPLVLTAAAGAGYAYTEGQPGESGAHHRGTGSLGVAVQPLRFLAASLLLDGQFDSHPADVLGSHSTVNGAPTLAVRAAEAVGKSVALGGELDWRVPGGKLPSFEPGSSTLDMKALATFAGKDIAGALNVGYRLDRSSELVDNRLKLRRGDRIALGASQFDAFTLGAGVSKKLGRAEIFGELTWDILLGSKAPSATVSPLLLGLGGRFDATENLQAELRAEVDVGSRPGTQVFDPIAPVPARFAIIAGLRFSKGPPKPATTLGPDGNPIGPNGPNGPTTAPTTQTISGVVLGDKGEPIADATVTVGDKSVQTAADGSFSIPDVPGGKQSVTVKAPGYEDGTLDANGAGTKITVKHAIKPGQLRGLVRSFAGKPLAATVRVEPLGVETKTDADGVFTVDVPPGSYEVVVTAPGFAQQRRKMQVEENGVTILNADLRQGQ